MTSELFSKPVVVTGGCGFVGRNLVERLLSEGATVTVVDLPTARWHDMPPGIVEARADILDPGAVAGVFDGAEIVYHLAARTDLDGATLADYEVNYAGTLNLIDECARAARAPRFVFYSTQLVVGLFNEARFIDETEPYRTRTVYGQSKIEGERVVMKRCRMAGIPYTDHPSHIGIRTVGRGAISSVLPRHQTPPLPSCRPGRESRELGLRQEPGAVDDSGVAEHGG